MVLLHELAHVRRWDNLVNFGQRLVESLLFFHPAVWWVSRWVRRDREECCDAVVVAQTEKPQAYAELLVALATPTAPLAGLALAQHPLASRIRRILHLEEEKMLITRSTLGLVGFFVVALLGIVLWQPATPTIAQESSTPVAPGSAGGSSKDKATEDTESTEEIENGGTHPAVTMYTRTYAADTPHAEVQKFIASLKAKGREIYLNKHKDGSITVSGVKKKIPATPVQPPPSVFPTLEAQLSADLAYKLLGVELEQLDKEELARVKAMKFTGGLRVSKGIRKSKNSTPLIAFGDLLVGLHVWPTTSLAEVKKVLDRDDLQDLSPLKFYVIRKITEHSGRYGGGIEESKTFDKLVTGRIEVNIDAVKKQTHSSAFGGDPIFPAYKPHASFKPSLLYDNKTFFDWKSSWRRDLSPELRAKAVRAFVAFANAGKDKDAIDEIFAIVAEYDWTLRQNGFHASDPAKNACLAAFTGTQMRLNTDTAVKIIIAKKDSKNARVHDFVRLSLHELSQTTTEVNKQLREAFPKAKLNKFSESGFGGSGGARTYPAPSK